MRAPDVKRFRGDLARGGPVTADAVDKRLSRAWEPLIIIFGGSFKLYRANPVLVVPPAVYLISSFTVSALSVASERLLVLLISMPFTFLISFIVTSGQAGMTRKVVLEGRVRIGEWVTSVKRYFFRVLKLKLLYTFTLGVVLAVAGIIGEQAVVAFAFFGVVAGSVFRILLAPAIIDDRGVGDSIGQGFGAIRRRSKAFLVYVLLVWAVGTITSFPVQLTGIKAITIVGDLTLADVATGIITAFISPIYYLIAFIFYVQATRSSESG